MRGGWEVCAAEEYECDYYAGGEADVHGGRGGRGRCDGDGCGGGGNAECYEAGECGGGKREG